MHPCTHARTQDHEARDGEVHAQRVEERGQRRHARVHLGPLHRPQLVQVRRRALNLSGVWVEYETIDGMGWGVRPNEQTYSNQTRLDRPTDRLTT